MFSDRCARNLNLSALLFLLAFLLYGCSPSSQFQHIDPEYKNKNESNITVMVIPIISQILDIEERERLAERKNRERKTITTREIELFDNYFPQLLSDNSQAKFSKADKETVLKDFRLTHKIFQNETNQKFDLYIPSQIKTGHRGTEPDYLALFTDVYFRKNYVEKGDGLGRGSQSSYLINAGVDYELWDNKRGKIAAYGRISQNLKLIDAPSKEDYLTLLEKMAVAIIRNSPFASKKIYF